MSSLTGKNSVTHPSRSRLTFPKFSRLRFFVFFCTASRDELFLKAGDKKIPEAPRFVAMATQVLACCATVGRGRAFFVDYGDK